MGWSCAADAGNTMDRWTKACVASTGSQNTFRNAKGEQFFWDLSRTEHADGAITGSVFRMLPDDRCRKTSTFRIEGDGTVTRAPAFLKRA